MADPTLSLLYAFDEEKVLTSKQGLGPTLAITNSNGSYFDSSGVLQKPAANVARFNHNPNTNASLGLLAEPAATNIINPSEAFDDGNWVGYAGGVTVTADDTVAPDGTTTADRLDQIDGNFDGLLRVITLTASSTYAISFFAKNVNASRTRLFIWDNNSGSSIIELQFDWASGVPTTASSIGASNITYTQIGSAGGWYRISFTGTTPGTVTTHWMVFVPESQDTAVQGCYIWGAQIEKADTVSSYIATTSSTVTRAADVPKTTDMTWLDAAATAVGTWYIRGSFPFADAAAHALLTLDDGGTTDRFYFERDAAENINFATTHSADTDGLVSGTNVIAADTEFQVAASYADDAVAMAVDNTLEAGDSAAAFPLADNPTTLRIGADSAGNQWNGHIAELRYYNVQKSDAFVKQLSNGEITETFGNGLLRPVRMKRRVSIPHGGF